LFCVRFYVFLLSSPLEGLLAKYTEEFLLSSVGVFVTLSQVITGSDSLERHFLANQQIKARIADLGVIPLG